jgi:hypothetical protein
MDPRGNAATALAAFESGDEVEVLFRTRKVVHHVRVNDALPLAHKLALVDMRGGNDLVKYGAKIGRAAKEVGARDYVGIPNTTNDRTPPEANMLGHTR